MRADCNAGAGPCRGVEPACSGASALFSAGLAGTAADPALPIGQALVPLPSGGARDLLGIRRVDSLGRLISCWLATLCWTFSFDTVYAMADRPDDARLGLRSSALTLGRSAVRTVRAGYGLAAAALAVAAAAAQVGIIFWPFWLVATIGFWRSTQALRASEQQPAAIYARHFGRQVQIGTLLLVGLVLSRLG